MRNRKKTKKHTIIDKALLAFPIRPRIRKKKYRDTFKDRECIVCQSDQTVIPAHIRHGLEGGAGLKPDDALILPLCGSCHELQGKNEVLFWIMAKGWTIDQAKTRAVIMFETWKENL